jgi:hypothetical protein
VRKNLRTQVQHLVELVLISSLVLSPTAGEIGYAQTDGPPRAALPINPAQPVPPVLDFLPRIGVPAFDNGRVLAPGDNTTLFAQVKAPDGAPLADQAVIFVAPDTGPSGTFLGADATMPHLFVAQTDSGGLASAQFTANEQPGVYLVDAFLPEAESGTSFAITNGLWPMDTARSPADIRNAIESQLNTTGQLLTGLSCCPRLA